VFHGSGCYDTSGIDITRPVTIDGGTYYDGTSSRPPDGPVLPIIRIKDTTDVTIENVALQGANTDGGFHRHLVGAAGLDILSSSHVTITHVATIDTFGDGMTVFANFPTSKLPTTDLLVDGLDITQAGPRGDHDGLCRGLDTRRCDRPLGGVGRVGISRAICPEWVRATSP